MAALYVILAVRASDEHRWSNWWFGDSQTMLSLRQWEDGGWFSNYLLFKPQGYANVVDLLDDPELRQHAHGTCPSSSPRVGPRLWYTHYPAGYLIPYATLFRMGLDNLMSARMLSLLFSFGALILMYLLFARITSPRVSFLAVMFYAFSTAFLGYADSLANQPLDDILRFGFMYAVVEASRTERSTVRGNWMAAAWGIEFALSLSSFDSVFFVYSWLIGWDILKKRGFQWKTYLLFSIAPVTAHSLQLLQNVWYLGWNDALIDIRDAFLLKHGSDAGYNFGEGRIATILTSVGTVFQNLYSPAWLLLPVTILYIVYKRANASDDETPSLMLLVLLFVCGLMFILILPHAARMSYQPRQMVPFAALLVSGFTWTFIKVYRASLYEQDGHPEQRTSVRLTWPTIAYLAASGSLVLIFWYGYVFMARNQPDLRRFEPDIRIAEQLRSMRTQYEPVIFDAGGFSDSSFDYVPGYPQIMPIIEYYTGSRPVLCFIAPEALADDLALMVKKGAGRFSPIVLVADPGHVGQIAERLMEKGTISRPPTTIHPVDDRFAADLTDSVVWGPSR